MGVADRFRLLAAAFTDRVEAVPPDRWESLSPCEGWAARDVVRHMVGNVDMFFGMIGRSRPAGPSVDDDPGGAWAAARDAMQAALDDPDVAGAEYDGMFGRTTLEQSVDRFMAVDLVVHSWDLAHAVGGDERLDPDEVHRVYEELQPMDDMLRAPNAFGPKLDAPEGADEQGRLLAFLGRRAD
jgi:uncharacterized protein (TIGR03086 family)